MQDKTKKLLFVDDNEVVRKILGLTFVNTEFTLLEASSGEEALAIAERELPDFVILDVMMPNMDGYQVCAKLRAIPGMEQSAIVMLSALGQKKDHEKGLEHGADYYLTKPFLPSDLLAFVSRIDKARAPSGG